MDRVTRFDAGFDRLFLFLSVFILVHAFTGEDFTAGLGSALGFREGGEIGLGKAVGFRFQCLHLFLHVGDALLILGEEFAGGCHESGV